MVSFISFWLQVVSNYRDPWFFVLRTFSYNRWLNEIWSIPKHPIAFSAILNASIYHAPIMPAGILFHRLPLYGCRYGDTLWECHHRIVSSRIYLVGKLHRSANTPSGKIASDSISVKFKYSLSCARGSCKPAAAAAATAMGNNGKNPPSHTEVATDNDDSSSWLRWGDSICGKQILHGCLWFERKLKGRKKLHTARTFQPANPANKNQSFQTNLLSKPFRFLLGKRWSKEKNLCILHITDKHFAGADWWVGNVRFSNSEIKNWGGKWITSKSNVDWNNCSEYIFAGIPPKAYTANTHCRGSSYRNVRMDPWKNSCIYTLRSLETITRGNTLVVYF